MAQSQPPPSCTPPPRDRHAWYKRPNIVIPAVLLVLGVVAWVVVGNGGTDTSPTKGSAAGWVVFDLPKASGRLVMQPLASSEGQAFWVF